MKNLCLIFIGLLISNLSIAQIKIGFTFGVNVANQKEINDEFTGYPNGDKQFTFKPHVGIYANALCEIPIVKQISGRVELGYIETGRSGKARKNLIVPFGIEYHANEQFSLLLGGYVSYLTNMDLYPNQSIDDLTKRYDWGPRFGMEYTFKEGIGLGSQYCWGLRDVEKLEHSPQYYGSQYSGIYNRGLQVYVHYKFKLKKSNS